MHFIKPPSQRELDFNVTQINLEDTYQNENLYAEASIRYYLMKGLISKF